MSVDEIKTSLKDYLQEELFFDLSHETDESDIFATGNIDSLGFVGLVTFLQSRYGIRFAPSDLNPDSFRTVSAIADLVRVRMGAHD